MKEYISHKKVMAEPMTYKEAGEAGLIRDFDESPLINMDGYKVQYKDGYESWSPKKEFDEGYVAVESSQIARPLSANCSTGSQKMTREEAIDIETIDEAINTINKIYDDIENKICCNCKFYQKESEVPYWNHSDHYQSEPFINSGERSWTSPKEKQDTIAISDDKRTKFEFIKPDYKLELLKVYNDCIIGARLAENGSDWVEEKWNLSGKNSYKIKYNLTPVQKPWYLTCKFPCLVVATTNNSIQLARAISDDRKKISCGNFSIDTHFCRPATKEEVDTLIVKDFK